MKRSTNQSFAPLQQWLKRTGYTRNELLAMLEKQEGMAVSKQHLSAMFMRRWGCSLALGIALSRVTGVPVEKLVLQPKVKRDTKTKAVA